MPNHRRHRGPHPKDRELFSGDQVDRLVTATSDLCWMLSRGYASKSATELVGNRYGLESRQRIAVGRSACSDAQTEHRSRRSIRLDDVSGKSIWIDGFNLLTTIEAALAGGVVLIGADGAYRDMASMHGSYRRVEETSRAIEIVGDTLQRGAVSDVRWFLDQPVSNSGRLRQMLLDGAQRNGWNWSVELVRDPDVVLKSCDEIVVSSDRAILDQARLWLNTSEIVLKPFISETWILNLSPKKRIL